MLDDLRNSASTFVEEEPEPTQPEPAPRNNRRRNSGPFLGMTSAQRFVVALLLFLMTWVLGVLFLVVMDKMVITIPGLF